MSASPFSGDLMNLSSQEPKHGQLSQWLLKANNAYCVPYK